LQKIAAEDKYAASRIVVLILQQKIRWGRQFQLKNQ